MSENAGPGVPRAGDVVERDVPLDRISPLFEAPAAGDECAMADGRFRVLAAEVVDGTAIRYRLERIDYWPPDTLYRFGAAAGMLGDRDED